MDITLHYYWSVNPQKVRLALEELGLDYRLKAVDLVAGEQRKAEHLALHPRGKVPVLEVDGAVCWESSACLSLLGHREQRLWPRDLPTLAQAHSLLHLESGPFQQHASIIFYNRVVLPRLGLSADTARIQKAEDKLAGLLHLLEARLEKEGDYLLGEFSLVDCAYAPWLPVLQLDDFPRLRNTYARLQARPSWSYADFQY